MTIRLTREGYDKLKNELTYLGTTKRKEVVKAIEVARAHGDLRENAEYDAAKTEQGLLEKRIAELSNMLSGAQVIDKDQIDTSKAYLGTTLTIQDLTNDTELRYILVNKEEASLKEGKISIDSPVGKALLGKPCGEEVQITIPAGTLTYKITKIER